MGSNLGFCMGYAVWFLRDVLQRLCTNAGWILSWSSSVCPHRCLYYTL